jgi:hypothetical protein
MRITRHEFLKIGGAAAASVALRPFTLAADAASDDTFYVALIADSHIIDDLYKGSESNRQGIRRRAQRQIEGPLPT